MVRVLHSFYLAVECEAGKGKDLGRARRRKDKRCPRVAWPIAFPANSRKFLVGGGSTSTGALLPGWAGHRCPAGGFSDTCQAPADELLRASAGSGNFQIFVLCFPVRNDVHRFPTAAANGWEGGQGTFHGRVWGAHPNPRLRQSQHVAHWR